MEIFDKNINLGPFYPYVRVSLDCCHDYTSLHFSHVSKPVNFKLVLNVGIQ